MEEVEAGHPTPRGTAQSLSAEKAFNAPLMALFSSAAFLALSISRTGWPTSKDSITERRIDWSLQFYLLSLRAFDGQDELCWRGPFLGEEGRGMGLQATISPRKMGTLPPAWRRHCVRVGKDGPLSGPQQLRRGLQPSPLRHLAFTVMVIHIVSWSYPQVAHHTDPVLSHGRDFLAIKVESEVVACHPTLKVPVALGLRVLWRDGGGRTVPLRQLVPAQKYNVMAEVREA